MLTMDPRKVRAGVGVSQAVHEDVAENLSTAPRRRILHGGGGVSDRGQRSLIRAVPSSPAAMIWGAVGGDRDSENRSSRVAG